MTLPFKVEYALVCDQIRREDNGKLLLVGVYGSSVLVAGFPASVSLSLLVKVIPTKLGASKLEFRVKLDGDVLASGDAEFELTDHDGAFAGLPSIPLILPRSGVVKWEMRAASARWTTLAEINVGLRASSSSA